jgi:hypothetical protein
MEPGKVEIGAEILLRLSRCAHFADASRSSIIGADCPGFTTCCPGNAFMVTVFKA